MSSVLFLFDFVNALAGIVSVFGVGILQEHFIVIDERSIPFAPALIIASDLVGAARLLGLEYANFLLCLRHALVFGVKRREVREIGDGLAGDTLIVLGSL